MKLLYVGVLDVSNFVVYNISYSFANHCAAAAVLVVHNGYARWSKGNPVEEAENNCRYYEYAKFVSILDNFGLVRAYENKLCHAYISVLFDEY